MRLLYYDCFYGISGNMNLAALFRQYPDRKAGLPPSMNKFLRAGLIKISYTLSCAEPVECTQCAIITQDILYYFIHFADFLNINFPGPPLSITYYIIFSIKKLHGMP
jgi:hypothetical protein